MVIECDKSQTKRYFDAQVTPFYEKESLFLLLVCNSVIASVFVMLLLWQIPGQIYFKTDFSVLWGAVSLGVQDSRENSCGEGRRRLLVSVSLPGWWGGLFSRMWEWGGCESCLALVIPLLPEPCSLIFLSTGCGWLYLECYKHPRLS